MNRLYGGTNSDAGLYLKMTDQWSKGWGEAHIVLGLVLCVLFAGSVYWGDWLAYGIASGCALACIVAAVVIQTRFDRLQGRAMDALIEFGTVEAVAMTGGRHGDSLRSLAVCMETMRGDAEFLEAVFRELGHPAYFCDAKGNICGVTRPLLVLLGKPAEKVVGETVSQAFFNSKATFVSDEVLRSGKSIEKTLEITLWDGRSLSVDLVASAVSSRDNGIRGVVVSLVDTTKRFEQQREIEEQQSHMARAGKKISDLAEHVAAATELLSASADDQAQGAQSQRVQTVSVANSMEEMTVTVLEVARNASATSEAADQAYESAGQGASMVSKAVAAINEVAESAQELGREVGELDSRAAEIGRIISVINDIADQTNLLALNAAIEAARAGEAGRGFAVVADEVRKLAEKTVAATKEVEEAIGTIQTRSRHAMTAMRQTEQQVGESKSLSNRAGEALQTIMESIKDMVGRITQIATAAEEQSAAAEEITHSIGDIADIAGEADEAAGQAASATRDLAELAQDLLNLSKGVRGGVSEMQLRESESEMKGILLKLAQSFVRKKYGEDVYEGMQEEMGHPVFLPAESYPDQVLMQMAELTSVQAGISVRDFFLDFGRFSIINSTFGVELYPSTHCAL